MANFAMASCVVCCSWRRWAFEPRPQSKPARQQALELKCIGDEKVSLLPLPLALNVSFAGCFGLALKCYLQF